MTVSRARAERGLRGFVRTGRREFRGAIGQMPKEPLPDVGIVRVAAHAIQRQGDEMACRCGARWPVGEEHP